MSLLVLSKKTIYNYIDKCQNCRDSRKEGITMREKDEGRAYWEILFLAGT